MVPEKDDNPAAEPLPDRRTRKIGMDTADAGCLGQLRSLRSALGLRHEIDAHGMENFYHGAKFGFGLAS
ncbi:hypothetical protein PMI42_03543 [Bradyrhizobium sp. YR681]|nr:hypothetical protein PMI42_03543 [Bradyrhizobium sp. YR681]